MTVPVHNPVVAPPVVTDDEQQRSSRNRGSDLRDLDPSATSSQDNSSPVVTFAATGTQSGADISGLGATDVTVSGGGTDVTTVTDPNTVTLVVDLPPAEDTGDPVPTLTAIDLNSDVLSGMDIWTDAPVAPPLPEVMVGSLDLVRRDLEQMFAPLTDETQQDNSDTLIVDEPSNDSGPVLLAAAQAPAPPSSKVSDPLTVDPTLAERTAAFQKDQAKRIAAFNEAQAARIQAFNEQQAEMSAANPIGALLNSAAFVVSELVNTAATVVTEFVNYISFGITQFVQGISEWFTRPAVFTGMYGDPATNAQYWQRQSAENCVLQSAAMIVGQLKGLESMPTEVEIAGKAMAEVSVVNPPETMYKGLTTDDRVDVKDAIALLDKYYGITASVTKYDKTEGDLALRALALALQDKKAVSVGLQGGTIWSAVEGNPAPGVSSADHQVVVIGVDFDARVVHLNDSGFHENGNDAGRNLKVSLDTFMSAWQTDNYETVIATIKQPNTSASGVTSTNVSGPTVLVNVA